MRLILALAMFSAVFAAPSPAQAEKRVFIIGTTGRHQVDHCLTSGARCGATAATAFCKGREFDHAASHRKVDRDDITGAVPVYGGGCHAASCADFVAIECVR